MSQCNRPPYAWMGRACRQHQQGSPPTAGSRQQAQQPWRSSCRGLLVVAKNCLSPLLPSLQFLPHWQLNLWAGVTSQVGRFINKPDQTICRGGHGEIHGGIKRFSKGNKNRRLQLNEIQIGNKGGGEGGEAYGHQEPWRAKSREPPDTKKIFSIGENPLENSAAMTRWNGIVEKLVMNVLENNNLFPAKFDYRTYGSHNFLSPWQSNQTTTE